MSLVWLMRIRMCYDRMHTDKLQPFYCFLDNMSKWVKKYPERNGTSHLQFETLFDMQNQQRWIFQIFQYYHSWWVNQQFTSTWNSEFILWVNFMNFMNFSQGKGSHWIYEWFFVWNFVLLPPAFKVEIYIQWDPRSTHTATYSSYFKRFCK